VANEGFKSSAACATQLSRIYSLCLQFYIRQTGTLSYRWWKRGFDAKLPVRDHCWRAMGNILGLNSAMADAAERDTTWTWPGAHKDLYIVFKINFFMIQQDGKFPNFPFPFYPTSFWFPILPFPFIPFPFLPFPFFPFPFYPDPFLHGEHKPLASSANVNYTFDLQ